MKTILKTICNLLTCVTVNAGTLDVSLEVNEENGRCVLKVTNTSPEPVTILKAFDRASGMSDNLPMGTAYKFGEGEKWIQSYRISSQLSDHGVSYTKDTKGNVIEGPKQPLVVMAPKEEISTEFSLESVLRWMWKHVEKRRNGEIQMKESFHLRAGVFVQKSETEFEFIHAGSGEISYPHKGRDMRQFIALQSKILEIIEEHQPDPFEKGTSNLKKVVQQKIEGLELEKLPSEQLYRLGVACSVASYPQTAGDQNWDLVFDDVCWRCVKIIATRPGSENSHYLNRMKALFGTDGGPSLWFKELIAKQGELPSEQEGGGQPDTRPELE